MDELEKDLKALKKQCLDLNEKYGFNFSAFVLNDGQAMATVETENTRISTTTFRNREGELVESFTTATIKSKIAN